MITVINEPQVKYKVRWQIETKRFSLDDVICDIENEMIRICQPIIFMPIWDPEKPKIKLSALRGKISKQNNEEIDKQISNLRSEWERNI